MTETQELFKIYTHQFELGGKTYNLVPVTGKYIGLFMKVVNKLDGIDTESNGLSEIDSETMEAIHLLCLETFKASYPDIDEESLNKFVTQNIFKLVDPVFSTISAA